MITGTATPFRRVGSYRHCFTASVAAASSSGMLRKTLISDTWPRESMVHSRITTPCTRACLAISGYRGETFLSFFGSAMCPPTRKAFVERGGGSLRRSSSTSSSASGGGVGRGLGFGRALGRADGDGGSGTAATSGLGSTTGSLGGRALGGERTVLGRSSCDV